MASLLGGEQTAVAKDVAQAMRDSGLAHILSISGLHIVFVVGLVMGLALTATSMSIMFGAVGRVVQPQYRTIVFGVVTAGASATTAAWAPVFGSPRNLASMTWPVALAANTAQVITTSAPRSQK